MTELQEMIKIADIHASRILMALQRLEPLYPLTIDTLPSLQDLLLITDLLVHRFGKLQDLLGNKIINRFLVSIDEYDDNLSMLDKIHKLERMGIIEDSILWKEMRRIRNHITHEYPDHPEFTVSDLNQLIKLAPKLIQILNNIKKRIAADPLA